MAAIVSVVDGVTTILATHINQYATTLNTIFGITDTAQANLGRLPFPWLGADPALANGLAWMRSDQGPAGRLKIQHNAQTRQYIPLNTIYRVNMTHNALFSAVNNGAYADITGLTTGSVPFLGTAIRVSLVGGDYQGTEDGTGAQIFAVAGSGANALVILKIGVVIDGGIIRAPGIFQLQPTVTTAWSIAGIPAPGILGVYTITPGNHTVKLQANYLATVAGGGGGLMNLQLVVEDID